MRRALAAVALLAFLPNANAQDKAKAEINHNGEFRLRDTWMMNQKGDKDVQPSSKNGLDQRLKFDLGVKANEKLSANVTLLNNFTWGQSETDTVGIHDGSQTEDLLNVNQAYASWMASEGLTLKFGRMNYQIGDGALIGVNDWEAIPYSFEGLLANYEAEFGRIQFFAFKHREITTGTTSDPEQNSYGLNFDLKTSPEWLKMVNVHLLKDTADAVTGNTTEGINGGMGKDFFRYGLNAGFAFNIVDLKAWYEAYSGKYHAIAAGGAKTDTDANGNMMQAQVGVNFANFMGSRVFVTYHQDSGDKDTTSGKMETYDAYFHEKHGSAGMMDLFDWGNLTYIQIGWTGKPTDTTDVGLAYSMLSRTEKGANASTVNYGTYGDLGNTFNKDKSKLGDEIDLWAEHHYDSNLSTVARVGYFMPGDVYKDATPEQKDAVTQIMLEGRLTF